MPLVVLDIIANSKAENPTEGLSVAERIALFEPHGSSPKAHQVSTKKNAAPGSAVITRDHPPMTDKEKELQQKIQVLEQMLAEERRETDTLWQRLEAQRSMKENTRRANYGLHLVINTMGENERRVTAALNQVTAGLPTPIHERADQIAEQFRRNNAALSTLGRRRSAVESRHPTFG